MNAPETALSGKHTGAAGQLYMAFELSDKKWLLVVSDGVREPSRYAVDAGDQRAVLDAIAKAKARCALVGEVVVRSCYEAGRDGFWLHRWLLEQGIDNMVVAQLSQVRGVGLGGAWILVKELFGWRRFHNRRQVAGCVGLAPTPYSSGDSQTEQGIAKAGNKRARRIMVELGWSWPRYQPESALSQWFNQRFAPGGSGCGALAS